MSNKKIHKIPGSKLCRSTNKQKYVAPRLPAPRSKKSGHFCPDSLSLSSCVLRHTLRFKPFLPCFGMRPHPPSRLSSVKLRLLLFTRHVLPIDLVFAYSLRLVQLARLLAWSTFIFRTTERPCGEMSLSAWSYMGYLCLPFLSVALPHLCNYNTILGGDCQHLFDIFLTRSATSNVPCSHSWRPSFGGELWRPTDPCGIVIKLLFRR